MNMAVHVVFGFKPNIPESYDLYPFCLFLFYLLLFSVLTCMVFTIGLTIK